MDNQFQIEMIEGDDYVLKLSGDLSAWGAHNFWSKMKDLLEGAVIKENQVLVDFGDLTYIHSSGIGALLQLLAYCRDKSIPIRFVNIHGSVERIFTLANVIDIFPIE